MLLLYRCHEKTGRKFVWALQKAVPFFFKLVLSFLASALDSYNLYYQSLLRDVNLTCYSFNPTQVNSI